MQKLISHALLDSISFYMIRKREVALHCEPMLGRSLALPITNGVTSVCAGCITHGWMSGHRTLPLWSHWILEVISSGYPVIVLSVLHWLATVKLWYAPFFEQ